MSDPHMLVDNGVCYLFTGHDVGTGQSAWVMPDWRIYRSTDLQSWELVGTILPEQTYMGKGSANCWAGDVVKRNGQYYFFFSNRDKNIGVMVASKPEGPYKDALGKPLCDSYDPTIFIDDDNTPYMIFGTETYYIARLKDSLPRTRRNAPENHHQPKPILPRRRQKRPPQIQRRLLPQRLRLLRHLQKPLRPLRNQRPRRPRLRPGNRLRPRRILPLEK